MPLNSAENELLYNDANFEKKYENKTSILERISGHTDD